MSDPELPKHADALVGYCRYCGTLMRRSNKNTNAQGFFLIKCFNLGCGKDRYRVRKDPAGLLVSEFHPPPLWDITHRHRGPTWRHDKVFPIARPPWERGE